MKTIQKLKGYSMSQASAPGNLPIPVMQPTEHRMDEDAKSRMDDEGSSLEPIVNVHDASRITLPLTIGRK